MPRLQSVGTRAAVIAAIVAALIGATVLTGWALDVEPMRRVFFGSIQMLPNAALAVMAAAAALWLMRNGAPSRGAPRALWLALATFVALLGTLTFIERMTGAGFGIDMLLFPDLLRKQPYRPLGRMATNSTVALSLLGGSLLLLDLGPRARRLARLMSTAGLAIAALALVGHVYGARTLYQIDRAAGMAVPTALSFFALHFGALAVRPTGGWMGVLFSEDAGGRLARQLIFTTVLVPFAVGAMFILLRNQGLVGRETGVSLVVVAVIAILTIVTLRGAEAVQRSDAEQRAALSREEEARREAERANRVKSDFLAVMSHELRTPLNAIIGYGTLLADGIPDPATPAQRTQLARIAASGRHLLALIDEVLTLSRVELGQERITPERLDIAIAVEEALSMVAPQAKAKGLMVDTEIPPGLPPIETDAAKLRQVLVNLLTNAVKFTDQGRITLRVTPREERDDVVFEVRDTGIGISAEHLRQVFDPFWQVDQTSTRRAGGVGLGLHVTRRIVRLLGGDITVDSTPGEGSVFQVNLPRRWWGSTAEVRAVIPSRAAPSRAV